MQSATDRGGEESVMARIVIDDENDQIHVSWFMKTLDRDTNRIMNMEI